MKGWKHQVELFQSEDESSESAGERGHQHVAGENQRRGTQLGGLAETPFKFLWRS